MHRAIRRDLTRGELAGIRKGEKARRAFDVYLRRPRGPGREDKSHRNLVWEGDQVEAPVKVDVDGVLVKPWVTWFIDCATNVICGVAVTAVYPSRESILAALRAAILREGRYGPFGGLPAAVRVDQGRDFLSAAVGQALGRFAVPVGRLPGHCPWLKGTVEELNGAVERMFFNALPRYVHRAALPGGKPIDPDEPALTFEGFVGLLLEWVADWNRVLPKPVLGGKTPERAWLADPTPLDEVPAQDLRLMTLEDDGRVRKITDKGVQWKRRFYFGPWMTGTVNTPVRLRHMPHHDHEVEVFEARSGRYLGSAELADAATPEQVGAVLAARRAASAKVLKTLKAAARRRRERYAAVTVPQRPQRLSALTSAEAEAELAGIYEDRLASLARPGLLPQPAADPGWAVPRDPSGSRSGQLRPGGLGGPRRTGEDVEGGLAANEEISGDGAVGEDHGEGGGGDAGRGDAGRDDAGRDGGCGGGSGGRS